MANLKISTRLYGGFGILIALTVILQISAYVNFSKLSEAVGWNTHTYEVLGEVDGMLLSLVNIETGQRGFALTGNDTSLEPLNAGLKDFKQYHGKAKFLTSDNPTQQERLNKLDTQQQQWMAAGIDPVIALRRSVTAGKEKMENVVALEQVGKGKQSMDAMRVILKDIRDAESGLLVERSKKMADQESQTQTMVVFGGVLALLVGVAFASMIVRNLLKSLGGEPAYAAEIAHSIASGDLSIAVEVNDKYKDSVLFAIRAMSHSLAKIVGEVRIGTDTIATASSEIASGNLDLSSRTEQQAASLEETASSMEELTSTVKQNADNARQANQLAVSASAVAVKGGDVVAQVVTTMGSINDSAKKIVDIIAVIDGIAFQTNILALNAAVEAARAGEQGRGFAVVASEVRSLAQRSAAAAKEIKTLIGDSVEKVDAGSKLVGQAGATMEEIVDSVKRVTDIMAEIMAASQEQSAGIEQVNQAIGQMDQVTQQNAALVEQAAAAAESLQEQAGGLAEAVAVFKLEAGQRNTMAVSAQVVKIKRPAFVKAPRTVPAVARIARTPATKKVAMAGATDGGEWEQF